VLVNHSGPATDRNDRHSNYVMASVVGVGAEFLFCPPLTCDSAYCKLTRAEAIFGTNPPHNEILEGGKSGLKIN